MQAYGEGFAKVYNQRWVRFAQQTAPLLRQFYEKTTIGQVSHTMLDLCCGTGQLSLHFLENGYRVTGIDLSEAMLEHARRNTIAYKVAGLVNFIHSDVTSFSLPEPVGLAVSTFDALNHLPDFSALKSCFEYVFQALLPTGIFLFDLNTLQGLKAQWNGVAVEDTQDFFLLNRALWIEESQRGYTRITGFSRLDNGFFERFEETVYNSSFEMNAVRSILLQIGFHEVYYARLAELDIPIQNPEAENRVFFVVKKG
jgi:SAM-dependent methyltransferase